MKILVTGAAGYVGSQLVPALLADGHDVIAYDTFWFGDHLPSDDKFDGKSGRPLLLKTNADIRDRAHLRLMFDIALYGKCDAVIHLACLSNDPSAEMDPALTRAINYEAFEPLVVAAKEAGVRRFINCSTSSVYGISESPDVRENHPLLPITPYNTYKAMCEPLLFKHASPDFECVNVRPSTICGYSPRQRLDLVVNILTAQAYALGRITVLGGNQKRPNLHIDDMVDCYRLLLTAPADKVAGQTFNVGAGNITIAGLARIVQEEVREWAGREVSIETKASTDPRSYQVNCDHIAHTLGFKPWRTVADAVRDLCAAFDDGRVPDPLLGRDEYYNAAQMRKIFPPPVDDGGALVS